MTIKRSREALTGMAAAWLMLSGAPAAHAGTSVYIHGSAGRAGFVCESIQRHKGGGEPKNITIQIHKFNDGIPGGHGQTMRITLRDNKTKTLFDPTPFFSVPNHTDQVVATQVRPGTDFSVCGQFGHANIDGDFRGYVWY